MKLMYFNDEFNGAYHFAKNLLFKQHIKKNCIFYKFLQANVNQFVYESYIY